MNDPNQDTTNRPRRRRQRIFGATSALAALAGLATVGPAAPSSASTNTHTRAAPVGTTPSATSSAVRTAPRLFPLSDFDHSVASQPVSANSSNLVSRLVYQYEYYYGSIGVNRIPIFTLPSNQPVVPVALTRACYGSFL